MECPETGSFIGYKVVVKTKDPITNRSDLCILKLEIPEDAKRISTVGTKCRCDKAKVLEAYDFCECKDSLKDEFYSIFDRSFKYHIGKMVSVDNFDDNKENECSFGIHFFMTEDDVLKYLSNTYHSFHIFHKLALMHRNGIIHLKRK